MRFAIGHGIDYHNLLVTGREHSEPGQMILGGVRFDSPYKIVAHSDGDVVYHALTDALLGALGLGDLGTYWSDQNQLIAGIDSRQIVESALQPMREQGWRVVNIDVTIISDHVLITPPIREAMKQNLQALCACPNVNIKATRHENPAFYRLDGDVVLLLEREFDNDAN